MLAHILLLWVVVLLASVMRSFTGFGFALCAVPVFSLFLLPTQAVVLSASLTLSISLLSLRTYWGVVPLRPMVPLVAMALLGTAAGAALLSRISVTQFQLWVGIAVILACFGLTFFRPGKRGLSPVMAGTTGLMSGLMNGAFAIPGPPMIIYAMATEPQPERSRGHRRAEGQRDCRESRLLTGIGQAARLASAAQQKPPQRQQSAAPDRQGKPATGEPCRAVACPRRWWLRL